MIRQGDNFRLVEGEEAEVSLGAHFGQIAMVEARAREVSTPALIWLRPENDCKRWTESDDTYLRQLYRDHTDESIGVLLGRTTKAIEGRRIAIGALRSSW